MFGFNACAVDLAKCKRRSAVVLTTDLYRSLGVPVQWFIVWSVPRETMYLPSSIGRRSVS